MRIGRVLEWQTEVLPIWQKASPPGTGPAPDIVDPLPEQTCWLAGKFEQRDLQRLLVIPSHDWLEAFSSLQVPAIAGRLRQARNDSLDHVGRIEALCDRLDAGEEFAPPILVALSGAGPFVLLDGNHRAIALQRSGRLVGSLAIVGLHVAIRDYRWYRKALQVDRALRAGKLELRSDA